jgi:hypothetical protein
MDSQVEVRNFEDIIDWSELIAVRPTASEKTSPKSSQLIEPRFVARKLQRDPLISILTTTPVALPFQGSE